MTGVPPMVERIARRLAMFHWDDSSAAEHDWPAFIWQAQEIIAKDINEPTNGMLRAACRAMSGPDRPAEYVSHKLKHKIRYTAMMGNALHG